MLVERTIRQLQVGRAPSRRARELAQLGYMQWLGSLPGAADYQAEAEKAYRFAIRFAEETPAIAEFCEILLCSVRQPLKPLDLALPKPRRRGGARQRRRMLSG